MYVGVGYSNSYIVVEKQVLNGEFKISYLQLRIYVQHI